MRDLDDLYCRCMCGKPWTAHDATANCPDQPTKYRPMIGKFGRSENRPIRTVSEAFPDRLRKRATVKGAI